jgi:hypothetical protein
MLDEYDRNWDLEDEGRPEPEGFPTEPSGTSAEQPEAFPEDYEATPWQEAHEEQDDEEGGDPNTESEPPLSPPERPRTSLPPVRPSGVELPRGRLGWDGLRKGRSLAKPDEVRLTLSSHERPVDPRHLAAERPGHDGVRPPLDIRH